MPPQHDRTKAGFPSTCWTLVVSLKNEERTAVRDQNFARICETYWFPLYAFARHRGRPSHDAEDAVQGFFLSVVTGDYLARADHEKGKLRTFLLTGFTRYLKDLSVHQHAKKRGGDHVIISLDLAQAEEWLGDPSPGSKDDSLGFEREWARTTTRTAIAQLEEQAGKSPNALKKFKLLSHFLNPETSLEMDRNSVSEELGISPDACDKAIQRLRCDFRETVKELIAGTLENPNQESIREEMEQLQRALL